MTDATHAKLISDIAKKHLGIETLNDRKCDDLDFHDLAVWEIKSAIKAAYAAGLEKGRK